MFRRHAFVLFLFCLCSSAVGSSIPPNYSAYTLNPLYKENPTLGWAEQRIEEKLGRGVVATPIDTGKVYIGWRLLKTDPEGIAFNVYRSTNDADAVKLNAELIQKTTDFIDADAPLDCNNAWWVAPVVQGIEQAASPRAELSAEPPMQQYISLKLRDDISGRGIHKVGIGDLDGDGEYDFIIKRPGGRVDPGRVQKSPDTFKVEGYKRDGTFLWRMDLGWSIELGTWYSPMIVYDFDGDGKAEVALKTGEGDHRDENGQVLTGPEYCSVLNGETGEVIDRVDWIARGQLSDWGDTTGNRASRHMMGVAYLDGKTPSLLVIRGIYGLMRIDAWYLQDKKLHKAWSWSNQTSGWKYQGQGQHNIHVADIDGDGCDEILNGSIAIDNDGRIMWSTGLGHGDRFYISDIDPERPGLEVLYSYEDPHPQNGLSLWDARTGNLIWGITEEIADNQMRFDFAADIDPSIPGMECWGDKFFFSAQGKNLGSPAPPDCEPIWWDGDLLRELIQGRGFWSRELSIFKYKGPTLTSGIEGRVILMADILGDWREELITYVGNEMRIYTTVIPARDRRVCLMQDPIYRLDVALRAMGYDQVPMTSYYLGVDSNDPNSTAAVTDQTPQDKTSEAVSPMVSQTENRRHQVSAESGIDRRALVTRHNVTLNKPDPLTPLSVGNGEFAFTADITGLQTFPDYHNKGMPLGTLAQWGWHTLPNPEGYKLDDVMEFFDVDGRKVPYASDKAGGYSPAGTWLRANPHRLHLGQIGLRLTKSDGSAVSIDDLDNISQTLDLWTGLLSSSFEIEGQPVKVLTVCHPERDLLSVRIESPLLQQGRLMVSLAFPYGSASWRGAADWEHPKLHTTALELADHQAILTRTLDADRYYVYLGWSQEADLRTKSQHEFEIYQHNASGGNAWLEIAFAFSPIPARGLLPDFHSVRTAAAHHWQRFWGTGGAIDFSQCSDPRAAELERRVVLSQYLTAIQCCGSCPPQETGLVNNSWFGKFHLEMHWWHAVHFALWDRLELLERSLPWYQSILPLAKKTAEQQGYRGARWPKMTSPHGRESPSQVGVFLIWQQPHPIYYAELCYRERRDRETLQRYKDIVFETAEFMASYPVWDEAGRRYVLGPALIPAQESYGPQKANNLNPTFELAYWCWGLETAQKWRQRLGMDCEPQWDRVIKLLSHPTIREGIYTAIETPPYTILHDHPSMVAALGFVPPTPLIDPNTMRRTLDNVLQSWEWPTTWGWDYPMLAMTAARLGEPEKAVDALFIESQKNRYLANGHNYQSARLPLYLPGNGGLLSAVAMMAAGWDGCADRPTPGFPDNGKWKIRWEGLKRMP